MLVLAMSAGSVACALVAGLEDKQAFPDVSAREDAGANDARADGSVVAEGSVPIGVVQVVATGQAKPWGVAVDDGYVYWTNEGDNTVVRQPKAGGTALVIARDQYEPHRLIVDPTNIIWHNTNLANRGGTPNGNNELIEIAQLAKTSIGQDAGPKIIEDTRNTSRLRSLAIATAADGFLWTTWDDQVKRYRRDDNQGERDVAMDPDPRGPTAIAADDVNVYWFFQQPFEIWRRAKNFDMQGVDAGSAAIATLLGSPEISDMVVDQEALYMVTSGGVVLKVPTPNGGIAEQLGTGHPFPKAIVADDQYVYFTRTSGDDAVGQGAVVMFAKSGKETKVVAEGLDKPRGIAIDQGVDGSTTIYWATYGDGMIRRARVR